MSNYGDSRFTVPSNYGRYGHLEHQERERESMADGMLYWLGWKANLYDLKNAGWTFHMEHHGDYLTEMTHYILNLSHGHHKFVGRGRTAISNLQLYADGSGKMMNPTGMILPMEIHFANEHKIVSMEKGAPSYTEVGFNYDAYIKAHQSPMSGYEERVVTSDLFQPVKPNQILVPQQDVDTVLEQLLQMQEPKQKEIRERITKEAMRNEYRTKTEEIARIIKVA